MISKGVNLFKYFFNDNYTNGCGPSVLTIRKHKVGTRKYNHISHSQPFEQKRNQSGKIILRVPWIGKPSTNLEKEVITAMESCYGYISTRLVFMSKRMRLWPARMFYLPFRKGLSYMNTSATVTVGTYGKHLNDYRIALSNMFSSG